MLLIFSFDMCQLLILTARWQFKAGSRMVYLGCLFMILVPDIRGYNGSLGVPGRADKGALLLNRGSFENAGKSL